MFPQKVEKSFRRGHRPASTVRPAPKGTTVILANAAVDQITPFPQNVSQFASSSGFGNAKHSLEPILPAAGRNSL
jgi:hypothetical protein